MSDFLSDDLRQICIAHQHVWDGLEKWAKSVDLRLVQIPSDEDGTKNYIFAPRGCSRD